jgi:hypothetical protein
MLVERHVDAPASSNHSYLAYEAQILPGLGVSQCQIHRPTRTHMITLNYIIS